MRQATLLAALAAAAVAIWPVAATGEDKAAPTTQPAAVAKAETKAVETKAPEKCNCIFCQGKQALKEAAPWLDVFAEARLRNECTPNLLLDKEDRNFQRFRERFGVTPAVWRRQRLGEAAMASSAPVPRTGLKSRPRPVNRGAARSRNGKARSVCLGP